MTWLKRLAAWLKEHGKISTRSAALLVCDLFTGFFIALAVNLCILETPFTKLDYVNESSGTIIALITASAALVLFFLRYVFFLELNGWPLFLSAVVYACTAIAENGDDTYFAVACVVAVGFVATLLYFNNELPLRAPRRKLSECTALLMITAVYIPVASVVAYAACCRHLDYGTSTYDMGIFAQMYESMATDGSMVTTCERNRLMSHIEQHFSPIYYLLLPLYMVFRSPLCLIAAQPFVILSSVYPVFLLCRSKKLSVPVSLVVSVTFVFYPTMTAACFYDFHENLFLAPLILWLLVFIERYSRLGIALFAVLLLMVKEDAGFYLLTIGLYCIFYRQERRLGIVLAAAGITGFAATTSFISHLGNGTLSTVHYQNLIASDEQGIGGVLKTFLRDPALVLDSLFTDNKIRYILQMLLPLLFMPLLPAKRRMSFLFLLLPFLAFNIITNYQYQHNIGYQYNFGSGALLFYAFIENLSAMPKKNSRKVVAVISLVAAVLICMNTLCPQLERNISRRSSNLEKAQVTNTLLEQIPEEESIISATYFVPHLSRHDYLYMYPAYQYMTDYILLDMRDSDIDAKYDECVTRGYCETARGGYVIVMKWQGNEIYGETVVG